MRRACLALAALPVLAVLLAFAGAGCNGDETGPVAGELVVRLTTPSSDDRALLLRLMGEVTAIHAAPGRPYAVYASSVIGDTAVVAVVAPQSRALSSGDLLRFTVSDTRQVRSYAATLSQVAGADFQLRDLGQYALVVARP